MALTTQVWKQIIILWLVVSHRCGEILVLGKIKVPRQPTGPSGDNCRLKDGETAIPCPKNEEKDIQIMEMYMRDCLELEASGNMYGITCAFYPEVGGESCHHAKSGSRVACMYGFKVRPTRQQRKGRYNDAFVTVEFFGKIPPVTKKGGKAEGKHEVSEWIAIGFSKDKTMGDDLVIYCHPYMDKTFLQKVDPYTKELIRMNEGRYPDDIGVAINKYYTPGDGKQAYDVDKTTFNQQNGMVKNGKVTYTGRDGFNAGRWGFIHCKAEISTYILVKSKAELFTGIELDMQRNKKMIIFMAAGHCLQEECIGDHKNNTKEFAEIAKRSSPLSFHRFRWIWDEPVTLFQPITRDGATSRLMDFNQRQLFVNVVLSAILPYYILYSID